MQSSGSSIFAKLYEEVAFQDRYAVDSRDAVDVVIPVMHTNELWRANLLSIYREIPVNRLLISDDGCVDDSIAVAQGFPRLVVLDHRKFVSLGYSLRKLVEAVQTDWFVYLHSDVFLPPGWFEAMVKERGRFDWFEASQHTAILAEVPLRYEGVRRPFSGAQMGRRVAFDTVLPKIDDDFLYRNEDIIIAHMIEMAGFRYGRAPEALVYHEQMEKKSRWMRSIDSVSIAIRKSAEEELREKRMQLYGLLKYMEPDLRTFTEHMILEYIYDLRMGGHLDWRDFEAWVLGTNPGWWPIIRKGRRERQIDALYDRLTYPFRYFMRSARRFVRVALRMFG